MKAYIILVHVNYEGWDPPKPYGPSPTKVWFDKAKAQEVVDEFNSEGSLSQEAYLYEMECVE